MRQRADAVLGLQQEVQDLERGFGLASAEQTPGFERDEPELVGRQQEPLHGCARLLDHCQRLARAVDLIQPAGQQLVDLERGRG
eukprot:3935545-Rhodomonas_salina.2